MKTKSDDAEGSGKRAALGYVEIQPDQLTDAALRGLAEEFVSRAGTDYGDQERSFESKIQDVMGQLERGEVRIVFDAKTESTNLLTARELEALRVGYRRRMRGVWNRHRDPGLHRIAGPALRFECPASHVRTGESLRRHGAVVEHGQGRTALPYRRGLCPRVQLDPRRRRA